MKKMSLPVILLVFLALAPRILWADDEPLPDDSGKGALVYAGAGIAYLMNPAISGGVPSFSLDVAVGWGLTRSLYAVAIAEDYTILSDPSGYGPRFNIYEAEDDS